MITIGEVDAALRLWAPSCLAESWDNTGLLLGDPLAPAVNVMTCLTITPCVVAEAIRRETSLVVTHHPLPFRPIRGITTTDDTGRLLWHLASHRVGVLSLHTRYDSAAEGINQQLAESMQLENIQALEPKYDSLGSEGLEVGESSGACETDPQARFLAIGRGRWGSYTSPRSIPEIAAILKQTLRIEHLQHVASGHQQIRTVAIGCGSAGEFVKDARRLGCDLLVLGETTFHTCLEAQAAQVDLLLLGHFASERFAQEVLAQRLAQRFPAINVWCSDAETDPIRWL
ncbi:MAG: Nif3-like dinuclear metal center hexameric protein [Pirellulaceae bacterium]|nr:Nif3-like dinuclear metal center hexameric protein [Pirellulaceae bacterium]